MKFLRQLGWFVLTLVVMVALFPVWVICMAFDFLRHVWRRAGEV